MENKNEDRISNLKKFIFSSKDKLKDKFKNIFNKDKREENTNEEKKGNNANSSKENHEKKPIFSIEEDDFEKIYNYNIPDEEEDEIYEDEEEEEDQTREPNENNKQRQVESIPKQTNDATLAAENRESKNNKKESEDIKPVAYEEEYIDPNYICHRLYQKDFTIDLENLPFIQFYELKAKNKVFSFIGIGKNQKVEENHLALFDENFLYVMKDKEDINHCINNKQNFIRKCHKYYNLKTISSISRKKIDNDRISVMITFSLGEDMENLEYKTKTFNFFKVNGERFLVILDYYLKKLDIEMKVNQVD